MTSSMFRILFSVMIITTNLGCSGDEPVFNEITVTYSDTDGGIDSESQDGSGRFDILLDGNNSTDTNTDQLDGSVEHDTDQTDMNTPIDVERDTNDDTPINPDTPEEDTFITPEVCFLTDETCNNIDDDCDGTADEDAPLVTYYKDGDGDGVGTYEDTIEARCQAPVGYTLRSGDCDDNNPNINPYLNETCDYIDNNCDGRIDEGLAEQDWYLDRDGDGYGGPDIVELINCHQADETMTLIDGDCNDEDENIHPFANELCESGIDEDCDNYIDEEGCVLP